jgi:hypothetical protein
MHPAAMIRLGLAVLGGLVLAGCAPDRSDPRAVLTAYLEAVYSDDLGSAYGLVCEADREYRTLDDYVALESVGDSRIVRELARRTRFELVQLDERGDRARALVRVTQPDAAQVLGTAAGQILAGGAGFDAAADAALDAPVPLRALERRFSLVREADGWRVRVNWQAGSAIHAYLEAAQDLERAGQPAAAVESYRSALALDDSLFEIERRIAELEGGAPARPAPERIEPARASGPAGRAERQRELLRQLARQDVQGQGGSPDLVEDAARVPWVEGP